MQRVENDCVGCPPEMGCLGSSCPYNSVIRYYCDYCGNEDKLYHYDDGEVCQECLLKDFKVVEGSDW